MIQGLSMSFSALGYWETAKQFEKCDSSGHNWVENVLLGTIKDSAAWSLDELVRLALSLSFLKYSYIQVFTT
jgi:hypothetical protein